MTAVSPLLGGVLLQAEPEIDPDIVRPGFLPLLITVLLLGALVFLFFSMQKQMRKIRTPDDIEAEQRAADERAAEERAAEGRAAEEDAAGVAVAEPEEVDAPQPRPDQTVDIRSEVRSELGPDVRAEAHPQSQAEAPEPRREPREPRP